MATVHTLFDPATSTLTYVVSDPATGDAVVIDPVLDYDPIAVSVRHDSNDRVLAHVRALGLKVHWILETHAHADHLSGSQHLAAELGARVGIGRHITDVQRVFSGLFDLGPEVATDGSQFDGLFADGDVVEAGSLRAKALHTPGHTPACVSWLVDDAVFTGDALFLPDSGTGRCDFPGGSADQLYTSVHDTLYALPDDTRVFVGHDYQPGGREVRFETTIGASKHANEQLRVETSRAEYVAFRTKRDATLSPPRLLFPSIQVNVRAGRLPEPAPNGRRYLKLPIGLFDA